MLKPMRRAAIVAVICLAGSTVARAQEVPGVPTGVVLSEVMMDVQGTEAQLYGTLLGSSVLPQTLSGTSSTDLSTSSFTFSLNPGSTDLGQAISDTVSGQFNPNDGSYDWTSTGSWGTTVAWQENGNIQAISKDIIVPNWTLKS